jgi:hypothetical protein
MTSRPPIDRPTLPWWRVRMMWLVLGGPAIVVLSGLATAVIAFRGADAVVSAPAAAQGAARPALQGRNHAATGGAAQPR